MQTRFLVLCCLVPAFSLFKGKFSRWLATSKRMVNCIPRLLESSCVVCDATAFRCLRLASTNGLGAEKICIPLHMFLVLHEAPETPPIASLSALLNWLLSSASWHLRMLYVQRFVVRSALCCFSVLCKHFPGDRSRVARCLESHTFLVAMQCALSST